MQSPREMHKALVVKGIIMHEFESWVPSSNLGKSLIIGV